MSTAFASTIPHNSQRMHAAFAKGRKVLNVYFTAGYPALHDTIPTLLALQAAGVDIIEIGVPFSDPLADGPIIQASNQIALDNGMTLHLLLKQLKQARAQIKVPILLMGYFNPLYQYGMERFCTDAQAAGVDGVIVPDLPANLFETEYRPLFARHALVNIFLITPQTSEARVRYMDALSDGFLYMVSAPGVTGSLAQGGSEQEAYFERITAMGLRNPRLIGFGIADAPGFARACRYADGAIVGSAFVQLLTRIGQEKLNFTSEINQFVKGLWAA